MAETPPEGNRRMDPYVTGATLRSRRYTVADLDAVTAFFV
jgi:hypothetical protein